MARDVVFDKSLPASQPMIVTSEPVILDEIRFIPVSTFSAPSPTLLDDSAAVTMATAAINDDINEPTDEEYISVASRVDNDDIIKGLRKRKGQRAPRYDQIDSSKPHGKTARSRTAAASEHQSFTETVNHPIHSSSGTGDPQ